MNKYDRVNADKNLRSTTISDIEAIREQLRQHDPAGKAVGGEIPDLGISA